YPGSPEPLGWGECGRHCVAAVDVHAGEIAVELIDINRTRFEMREVDCSGCESSAAVAARLTELAGGPALFLRVTLVGEVAPDCAIDVAHIAAPHSAAFASLEIVDATVPLLDIEARIERK